MDKEYINKMYNRALSILKKEENSGLGIVAQVVKCLPGVEGPRLHLQAPIGQVW